MAGSQFGAGVELKEEKCLKNRGAGMASILKVSRWKKAKT